MASTQALAFHDSLLSKKSDFLFFFSLIMNYFPHCVCVYKWIEIEFLGALSKLQSCLLTKREKSELLGFPHNTLQQYTL